MVTAADRLSLRHQRDIATLAGGVQSVASNMALGADPEAIDTWYYGAVDGLISRVHAAHAQARASTLQYLTRHAALSGTSVDLVPASLDVGALRTSLRVVGPVGFKQSIAAGQDTTTAIEHMATRMGGVADRGVRAGYRDTVESTALRGEGVVGWRRILVGKSCGFCAMLASRGAVYVSERAAGQGDPYHDHCNCAIMPVYTRESESADVRELQRQWQRVTAGHSGRAARRVWREHWERLERPRHVGAGLPVPTGAVDPAMRMTVAQLRAVARANNIPLSLLGNRKADIVRGLRDWESTYSVRLAGLPEFRPARFPAARAPVLGMPPARPVITGPPSVRGQAPGNGDWADHLARVHPGDTPAEGLRASDLQVIRPAADGSHQGYTVATGTVWRFDGVSYLIEHGPGEFGTAEVARILAELRAAHAMIPAAARANRSYAVLRGANPYDAYWRLRYNDPNFSSGATAGNGHIWIYRFTSLDRIDIDSLRHETGHNLDSLIGRATNGSQSGRWARAVDADAVFTATITELRANRVRGLGQVEPSRRWPRGVTEYGRMNEVEDWAESVMLYQMGPIATGRLPSGITGDLYFRDIFPARTRILDDLFPDLAATQRAELAALRAATTLPDLSGLNVTALRAMAREAGIRGYSRMRKDELVAALSPQAKTTAVAPRIPPSKLGPDKLPIPEKLTVAELRALARANNISIRSGAKKADIIAAIRAAETADRRILTSTARILPSANAPSLEQLYAELVDPTGGARLGKSRTEAIRQFDQWVGGSFAGKTAKVTSVGTYTGIVAFSGHIIDPATGRNIGRFTRTIRRDQDGNLFVEHELLELQRRYQGSGFAAEFNGNLLDWYRRSGVKYVKVGANIDIGGYTWARAGYDFVDPIEAAGAFGNLDHTIRRILGQPRRPLTFVNAQGRVGIGPGFDIPTFRWDGRTVPFSEVGEPWTQAELRKAFKGADDTEIARQLRLAQEFLDRLPQRAAAGDLPSAYELSQLGRWDGAGKKDVWIGKLVMLGSSWLGILRL